MSDSTHGSVTPGQLPERTDRETMVGRLEACLADVSRGFERWDDPAARGPGLYFVLTRNGTAEFVAPMGSNRWPVAECGSVLAAAEALLGTARDVALSRDGAIVVHGDGTIEESMVRVAHLTPAEQRDNDELPFAGWMGARHMSALETSTRENVVAAITLSEEDGRVTVFTDGAFEDVPTTAPGIDRPTGR